MNERMNKQWMNPESRAHYGILLWWYIEIIIILSMEVHRSQTLLTAYPAWMRRMALCAGTLDRDGSLKRGFKV